MSETQRPPAPAERRIGPSDLRLSIYFGCLVLGVWLLIDVVLHLQLTEVLAAAISVTGAEWIMYLLIGLSVLSVGVTLERWTFYRRHTVDVDSLADRLTDLMRAGETDEALSVAETLLTMEGRAVAACLRCLPQGPEAMERQLAASLAQERLHYERHLIILGTLGNSAPFIGLFGTVLGIIKAFMDLAQDITGGAAVVMAGISEALVATALGLLVAIPSVIAYNALKAKVKAIGICAESLAQSVIGYTAPTAEEIHGNRMG